MVPSVYRGPGPAFPVRFAGRTGALIDIDTFTISC